jgi:dihydroorotase
VERLVGVGPPLPRGAELNGRPRDADLTGTDAPRADLPHVDPLGVDLLVRGGEVARRGGNGTSRLDVGIRGGRIVALGPDLGYLAARERLEAAGCLVAPGLVDLHAHVYDGVTPMGIAPDDVAFPGGVTTVADAGSAGPPGIAGFGRYVAGPARCRVRCLVNWSRLGLVGAQAAGELEDPRYADPEGVERVLRQYPDLVRGIKLRVSRDMVGGPCAAHVAAAAAVGRDCGRPLHLHIGHSVEALSEIAELLSPGDMITHCQTPKRPSLVDDELRLVPGMRQARERGVLFDSGHGKTHFDFAIARSLLEQDFPPDTLSSDISRTSYDMLAPGVLTVANKWWALGWPLGDVLHAMTAAAADWLVPGGALGRLEMGAIADLAVLDRVQGDRTYTDAAGAELTAREWLEPRATVFGGEVAWPAA